MKSKSGRHSDAALLRLPHNRRCTSNRLLLRRWLNADYRLSLRPPRETGVAVFILVQNLDLWHLAIANK
jgi:hypothetical protein